VISKKRPEQSDKKVHPVIGVLLFLISVVLLLITGPVGLLYGFFYTLIKGGIKGLGEYLLKIAISIDQLGNVLMQHLLNLLWIKKGGYLFGNRDETISSALGRNKKLGMLTTFGKGIDGFLDLIDPNHSLNSIDYYVEPSAHTIEQLAWICLENERLLCVQYQGKQLFEIPGGKRHKGESDLMALMREIKDALLVTLNPSSFLFLKIFEGPADGEAPGVSLRLSCYEATYSGVLTRQSEIDEMAWLSYSDRYRVSATARHVFDYLKDQGRLT